MAEGELRCFVVLRWMDDSWLQIEVSVWGRNSVIEVRVNKGGSGDRCVTLRVVSGTAVTEV